MENQELVSLILYKDYSFKIIECSKLQSMNLNDPKIFVIFIPNTEAPNSYIPIQPSSYYNFAKCTVSIIYQGFINSYFETGDIMAEDADKDFVPKEFFTTCYNVTDFINAIYNLWKFRGTSIFLSENNNNETPYSYESLMVYPRYYEIKFYDDNGNLKSAIDSGPLTSIVEKFLDKSYNETPIEYCQEEYLEPLNKIFFTPLCKDEIKTDSGYFGLLPRMICLEDNTWFKVKKPGQSLSALDYILVEIEDYGIFYYTQYGAYESFIKMTFNLEIYGGTYTLPHDPPILPSIDKKKIPSVSEKLDAVDSFITGNFYSNFSILAAINSPIKVIEIILFLRHIISCMHYLLYDIFREASQEEIDNNPNEGTRVRLIAIFNSDKQEANTPNRILSELELSDEKIQNAILSFLKEEM